MELNFRSDNESPAAPEIMQALSQANEGTAWSYAEDDWSRALDRAFSELFEATTTVIPISTGTAANSIALACLTEPWNLVFCHRGAHVFNDEGGAPEFFGHGLRLMPLDGDDGKLRAGTLVDAVNGSEGHGVHSYAAGALTLTQSTEAGTVYRPDEIAALCAAAGDQGLSVHVDGARFGNAIATLGCAPGACTVDAGVRMMSFGASKNGCLAAEALLIFGDGALRERAERLRKRSGHLLSKMRYVSAQLLAYIDNGLWLRLAAGANAQARRFAEAIAQHPQARSEYSVEANEVFVRWTPAGFSALETAGMQFLRWPGDENLARFVFSHATRAEETAALCEALASVAPA
ncbi:threonine aldolase family protein [Elongatibacter sediminis]|uniref:Beta-eliminating lyase-related protein n=1 Tax=Elongatibacter sediminis TaxID=3119006 RepID=A0AAW9RIL5_9GAMM